MAGIQAEMPPPSAVPSKGYVATESPVAAQAETRAQATTEPDLKAVPKKMHKFAAGPGSFHQVQALQSARVLCYRARRGVEGLAHDVGSKRQGIATGAWIIRHAGRNGAMDR